jgi:hypothetical protein
MENKYQRKQIVPKSTKADKMFYMRPPSPTQAEKDADRLEELKEQFKINKCVNNVNGGSSSKINPIDRPTISRLLCIDTTFRHNYTTTKSSDFIYTCPENIKKVTSLKISAIEIPNNWYAFSDALMNNIFTVTDNITKVVYVFKIPEGNYTSDDISSITLIQVSPTTPGIPDKAITVDIITSKTTIFLRNTGNYTINFEVPGLLLQQTAGWSLGFRKSTYVGIKEITSEGSYSASFDNYFFVDVDDYQSNFVTDAVVSVTHGLNGVPFYLGNTIMARIPVTTNSNSVMFNNGSDLLFKTREYFGPVKLEKLRIRLLNKFGHVIDMNQNDYSIAFEIKENYN